MGDIPADDALALISAAVALGWVDPDRRGVAGNSDGGYLSAWLACTTDRFGAAVVENPAIDLLSMCGTSEVLALLGAAHEGSTSGPPLVRLAHDAALVECADRWLRPAG